MPAAMGREEAAEQAERALPATLQHVNCYRGLAVQAPRGALPEQRGTPEILVRRPLFFVYLSPVVQRAREAQRETMATRACPEAPETLPIVAQAGQAGADRGDPHSPHHVCHVRVGLGKYLTHPARRQPDQGERALPKRDPHLGAFSLVPCVEDQEAVGGRSAKEGRRPTSSRKTLYAYHEGHLAVTYGDTRRETTKHRIQHRCFDLSEDP